MEEIPNQEARDGREGAVVPHRNSTETAPKQHRNSTETAPKQVTFFNLKFT